MRFGFFILLVSWFNVCAANSANNNVIFLHSYDDSYHWDQGLKRGFTHAVETQPNIHVYHEYMDAKRFPTIDHQSNFYDYLTDKFKHRDISALVIADDPAMDFYLSYPKTELANIPVIFMGINKISPELISSQHITGIFEQRDLNQAVIDIKSVLDNDELIVLTDTTATGMAFKKMIDNVRPPNTPQHIYYLEDMTPESLGSKIQFYSQEIPILVAGQLRDSKTNGLLEWERAFQIINQQVSNPFFSIFESGLDYGALGVYQLDPEQHAKHAAQLLIRYLQGTPINQLATVTELQSSWYWNAHKLGQYQITNNKLPIGSLIIGQPLTVYELNRTQALAYAAILFTSLFMILLLLVILKKNKQTQRALLEKVALTEKLAYEASHDYLTGLLNRRSFTTKLTALENAKFHAHNDTSIYIAILDLDNFKTVNDTAGHMVGDNLLAEISKIMTSYVNGDDILARLGGDEFGLIMNNRTEQEVESICFNIIDAVSQYRIVWNATSYSVGVCIGVVRARQNDRKEMLLSHADIACYKAKELGINHVYFTDSKDTGIQLEQLQLGFITDISSALEHNHFFFAKQKIQPLNNNEATPHYEMLLRYNDKNNNPISPSLFIPAAEKYGLVTLIDKWVIQTIFSQYKQLFPLTDPFISINLSGVSLSNAHFLEEVLDIIDAVDMDMSKVCFEVTETAVVSHINRAIHFINELKKTGCKFALDDFGSGSSSYGYLKKLPVDYVKIDGSLIRSILNEPIDYTIVKSINEISHQMGMQTIAEFVEDDDIQQKLTAMGIDFGQGYGIHKPEICTHSTVQ
jgi:diguanylate cyclase (GGDEF)-like protein